MFVWVWPIILWTKKTPFGGGFCSRGPNVKNQFFGKKIFGQIFWKKYFAQLMRNFFLILKWFYFLSFVKNWPICDLWRFKVFIFENGPIPLIFTGHIMKVYGEIGPTFFLKFQSVIIQIQSLLGKWQLNKKIRTSTRFPSID